MPDNSNGTTRSLKRTQKYVIGLGKESFRSLQRIFFGNGRF